MPLRRMNAITTSMRSAEWISVRIWLPTRGSPGALVSSVVSSSGMSGSGIASGRPSGSLPRTLRSTLAGRHGRSGRARSPRSPDDEVDELPREQRPAATRSSRRATRWRARPRATRCSAIRSAASASCSPSGGGRAVAESAEPRFERLGDQRLVEAAFGVAHRSCTHLLKCRGRQ